MDHAGLRADRLEHAVEPDAVGIGSREGEGVVAQCFCHETEHLDGHLFIEKVEEYVDLEQMQDGEEE